MKKINLESLIESTFKLDIKENNKHTSLTQVCLLSIKSLMPSNEKIGNYIDYKRFTEELKLWLYYRTKDIENLSNVLLGKLDKDIYKVEDPFLFFRIVPIIQSNGEYEFLENEVIKSALYTTGNIKSLFETLLITRLIYINKYMTEEDEVIEDLKKYIINFAQDEYLDKYRQYYRVKLSKDFSINFEKEKISIISILNKINLNKYNVFKECIRVLNDEVVYEQLNGYISKILYLNINNIDIDIHKFFLSMNEYANRLNKSRISQDSLIIKEYILPDIFSFNEGDVFFHSLLNKSKVIKKEVRENHLTSVITTKTGNYIFRKKLN